MTAQLEPLQGTVGAAALEQVRADVRSWLSGRSTGGPSEASEPASLEEVMAEDLDFQRELWDAGFTRRGWPLECGGSGGSPVVRAAVYEEVALAGYRVPKAVQIVEIIAPAIVAFAPHLATSHLGAYLRGDETWCQGFSEPDAGSDLASLRCRAQAVEGGWRVSGQKVWSTYGHLSSRCVLLARTGASGQRGLSMLLVDLDAPGCSVRPIRASSGRNEFSELFFDDVFVSFDRLIGEVDGGWDVAMYLMQFERGLFAWVNQAVLSERLRRLSARFEHPGTTMVDLLAEAWLRLAAVRALSAETVRRLAAGESPGPKTSVVKILLSRAEQLVMELHRLALEDQFSFEEGREGEVLRSNWFHGRAATIYGGALEIQQTIVAQRILSLPRPPR